MYDRKSLLSNFIRQIPGCITLTAPSHLFQPGDKVVVCGMSNQTLGGVWPQWMNICHIPVWMRFMTQHIADLFNYKFGPRKYQVTGVTSGNQITIR